MRTVVPGPLTGTGDEDPAKTREVAKRMSRSTADCDARPGQPWLAALSASARAMIPQPAGVIMFGSYARGEATPQSDVDVLLVRPTGIDFDDDVWADGVASWWIAARGLTGCPVEVIEAEEDEIPDLLARPEPTVWQAIASEGVVMAGKCLKEMSLQPS